MANPLTLVQLKEFLDYNPDTGVFVWRVSRGMRFIAGTQAGHLNQNGYVHIIVKYRQYKAHRLAWFYMYGVWPPEQIDHINGVSSDNRISNLRLATQSQNKINSGIQRNNTSGFKGVRPHRPNGKWQARIGDNGKRLSLGYYSTAAEAHEAYLKAAQNIYGEFVRGT